MSPLHHNGSGHRSGIATARWPLACLVAALPLALLADPVAYEIGRAIRGSAWAWLGRGTDIGKSEWYLVPGFLVMVGATLYARRRQAPRWRRIGQAAAFLFVTVASSGLAVQVLKWLFGRARPKLLETEGFHGFHPFTWGSDYASFPSGHANTMIAVGIVLCFLFPRWRWLFLLAAGWLALTRVIVGAHYLSDLVGGALVAVLLCFWWRGVFARRDMLFTITGAGVVRSPAPAASHGNPGNRGPDNR